MPMIAETDYTKLYSRFKCSFQVNSPSIFKVFSGHLGAFNKGYVLDIPYLVEKYLEIINQVDLLPFLTARQNEPVYDILVRNIAGNDPDRTRYFFNNVLAFHVIPELIATYVAKGYYKQALAFIQRMLKNRYISDFWELIKVDTGLDYYERAVYVALERTMDENDKGFVRHVIETHQLLDNELA
ncbi:hypothetical protein H4R34_005503, partial [Dimargaris verticillata]